MRSWGCKIVDYDAYLQRYNESLVWGIFGGFFGFWFIFGLGFLFGFVLVCATIYG